MKRWTTPLLALAIFILNVLLNAPLFMSGRTALPRLHRRRLRRDGALSFRSIPNPWGWNPLPYCGLPTQFMYVPALPYLTALFIAPAAARYAGLDLPHHRRADDLPGSGDAVFLRAVLHGQPRWAFAMALAYSLLSPSYALFPAVEKDRGIAQMPWRIKVLAKYGEGPAQHRTDAAAAGSARTLEGRQRPGLSANSCCGGAAGGNSFDELGSGLRARDLVPAPAVAAWGEAGFRVRRALSPRPACLPAGLFLADPQFRQNIAFNWPVDSLGYQLRVKQLWLLAGMTAGAVAIRLLFHWLCGSFYLLLRDAWRFRLRLDCHGILSLYVDTIPESHRYAIEFEFFLALAVMETLRLNRAPVPTRPCACVPWDLPE